MRRSELREHIFKVLFGIEFNEDGELSQQSELYLSDLEHAREADTDYIAAKVLKVADKVPEIDELINQNSKGWKTKRMNKVDLTILRLAVYEMKWDEEVPTGVAINEAVELSKTYSGEEGASFVNAVLGKIAHAQEE